MTNFYKDKMEELAKAGRVRAYFDLPEMLNDRLTEVAREQRISRAKYLEIMLRHELAPETIGKHDVL